MPDQKSAVVQVSEDQEYRNCLYYLMARAGDIEDSKGLKKKHSMQDIAVALGYTDRRALYYAVERWERDGILENARRAYLVPKMEEIQVATDEAVAEWPDILREMIRIVKGTNGGTLANPRTKWEIAAWLKAEVIDPATAKQVASGATEASYADALEDRDNFDPINIGPKTTVFVPKSKS